MSLYPDCFGCHYYPDDRGTGARLGEGTVRGTAGWQWRHGRRRVGEHGQKRFLKVAGGTLLAGASCAYAFRLADRRQRRRGDRPAAVVHGEDGAWSIDLNKCRAGLHRVPGRLPGREQRRLPRRPSKWDIHWIRKVRLEQKHDEPAGEAGPRSPCSCCATTATTRPVRQVCPVQATYKRDDGIVIVDHHRCIGCRYCMIACPYNARYFNFKENEEWPNKELPKRSHGVAEACTLCAHRLERGRQPACVEACEQRRTSGRL